MTLLSDLRKSKNLSERAAAELTGLARETLRACERDPYGAKVESLERIAASLDRRVLILFVPTEPVNTRMTTVAVSLAVGRDGFASWKIHFMDLVDEFR